MKFSEDYKKLKESSEFNLFKQENPDAFLSGCFFVKDNEAKIETRQIDFFMLHKNKIATFTISNEIFLRIEDQIIIENKRNPLEFIDGIECDFDKIDKQEFLFFQTLSILFDNFEDCFLLFQFWHQLIKQDVFFKVQS